MRWKINPRIKNSYVVWEKDAVVQHPLSGETLRLTGLAKDIFSIISENERDRAELLSSLPQPEGHQSQNAFAKEVMTIANQLVQKELIIQCQ